MSFDDAALHWDTPERIERANKLAASILHAIGDAPKDTALEFGCGTGLLSFALREHFQRIDCVDASEGMLYVLRQKTETAGASNIVASDSGLLAQKEYAGAFDVIYSSMVFHHITDVEAQLRTLSPLLKPNGLLITIDLDKEDGSFHRAEPDFTGITDLTERRLPDGCRVAAFPTCSLKRHMRVRKATSPIPCFYAGGGNNKTSREPCSRIGKVPFR